MLRKKWLSLLVAVSMVAAMMPTTAFAADGDDGQAPGTVITDGTQDQGDTQGDPQGDGQDEDQDNTQGDDQGEDQDNTQGDDQGEDQQDNTQDDTQGEDQDNTQGDDQGEDQQDDTQDDTQGNGPQKAPRSNGAPKATYVAGCNSQGFETLQEAVNEAQASGGGISLWTDIELSEPVEIPAGAHIVINGNGKTITLVKNNDTGVNNKVAFNENSNNATVEGLKAGTSLTVKNVNFVNGTGATNFGYAAIAGPEGDATIKLDGCSFKDMYCAVYCNAVTNQDATPSTVTISNATFDNVSYAYGITDNQGYLGKYTPNVTYSSENKRPNLGEAETFAVASVGNVGYTTLADAFASIQPGSTATVTLLKDVKLDTYVEVPAATITVEGNDHAIDVTTANKAFTNTSIVPEGLLPGTVLNVNDVDFVSDAEDWGHAVIMGSKGGSTANLSGCTFKNLHDAVYANVVTDGNAGNTYVNITESTFDNVTYSYGWEDNGRADKHFFHLEKNINQPENAETAAVAVVNGVGYTTLKDAFASITAGSDATVTLLKDVKLDAPVEVPAATITVEGKGHEINVTKADKAFTSTGYIPEGLLPDTILNVDNVDFVSDNQGVGHAVVMGSQGGSEATLSGCTFKNLRDAVYANPVSNKNAERTVVTIEGSTFEGVTYSYGWDDTGRTDMHTFDIKVNNTGVPENAETFAVATVDGVGYTDLQKAVNAAEGKEVTLLKDVTLDETLKVSQNNITLNLNKHTITASDTMAANTPVIDVTDDPNGRITNITIKDGEVVAGANNKHTVNVYNAADVVLENVKLDNTKALAGDALVVNGSDVTLKGDITAVTGDKSWHGMNVDSKVTGQGASLKLDDNANVVFEGVKPVGIYVENSQKLDKDKISVAFGEGSSIKSSIPNFKPLVFAKDGNDIVGTPVDTDNAGLIDNGDGSYNLPPVVSSGPNHNFQWKYNADKHWEICTDCGTVVNEGTHNFQWKKDGNGVAYQQCADCGYRKSAIQTAAAATTNNATASASASASTTTTAATATAAIPQTSDASNPLLWVVLLVISGSAFGGLMVYKKKKENC